MRLTSKSAPGMCVYMMNRKTFVSHITDQLGKSLGKPQIYQQQQKELHNEELAKSCMRKSSRLRNA